MKNRIQLDAFTERHLSKWCENRFYNGSDAFDSLLRYLRGMSDADLAYYLDAGWLALENAFRAEFPAQWETFFRGEKD